MKIFAAVLSKLAVLLILSAQGLCLELLKPIKNVHALADDQIAYDIASYFKGANKSLHFESDHPAVTIKDAFTVKNVDLRLSDSCRMLKKASNQKIYMIFGVCNDGKSIIKINADPVTWTIEGGKPSYFNLPEGLTARDFVVMNKSIITGSPADTLLIAAIKAENSSSSSITMIEVSADSLTLKKQTVAPESADGVTIVDPSIAYDSTTQNGLVLLWDRSRSNDNITLLAGRYNENDGFTTIGWISDITDDISIMIKFADLKNLYIDGDQIYPIYYQTNVKMAYCNLVVADKIRRIECSKFEEIFLNIDRNFKIALEILPNHELASINYYTDSLLRRVKVSTGMKINDDSDSLYFEVKLNLLKPIFIKSAEAEAVISGEDMEGKPVLLHWRTSRSYVSLNRDSDIRISGLAVARSAIDSSKTVILYFDSVKKSFQVLKVTGAQLLVQANNEAFKDGSLIDVPFKVSDTSTSRTYNIKVKILPRITDGFELNLPSRFEMYSGIKAEIPLFHSSFAGNSPLFTVTTNETNAAVSIYMSKKMELNLPQIEGQPKTIKNLINVGNDCFVFCYEGYFTINKCIKTIDDVECWNIYQNKSTDSFIDGRSEQNSVYLLAIRAGESSQQASKIVLWSLELIVSEEKDRNVQIKEYSDIDATGALGIVRISNFYVVIDVLARPKSVGAAWKLYTASFYAKSGFPETLNSSQELPPHACPVSMCWAPRKQPVLMVNSLCEKGQREILEFSIEYLAPNFIELVKTWAFNTRSLTDFCPTGSLLLIADIEANEVYGIDRLAGDLNKISFPLKNIGFEKLKGMHCTRHNDYFQVIASKEGSDYLITYRTNSAFKPSKRIHSIEKLADSTVERVVAQSHDYLSQEIFTMIFPTDSSAAEAFYFRLDTPKLEIDASKVTNTSTISVSVRGVTSIPGQSGTSTTEKVTVVKMIKQQTSLEIRPLSDKKALLNVQDDLVPIESLYTWEGLQLGQEIVGSDQEKNKLEIIKPLNYKKGLYNIKNKLRGVRSAGNVIFVWSNESIFVYENSAEKAKFPGVNVAKAEAITGEYSMGDSHQKESYTYFMGYSESTEKYNQRVFVVANMGGDQWKYADLVIGEGITHLEVHLIDPIKRRFIYGAANVMQESLSAAIFDMVINDQFNNSFLQLHKVSQVKTVHNKFAHVSMLMINKKIRMLYNLRSSNEIYSVTVDPATLNVESDLKIDFGRYTPMSFANTKFECTEDHSTFVPTGSLYLRNDRKFYCASADPSLTTTSFVMEYPEDDLKSPVVVNMTSEPIIQGYVPKDIRTQQGYTIVLLKKVKSFDSSQLPEKLQRESVLLQVWRSGENPIHTFVRLSDLDFPEVNVDIALNAYYSIDMTLVNGEKTLIVGDDFEENELRGASLSSLGVKIKDREVDLAKVKLRIYGLENSVDLDLSNIIAVKPHKDLFLIMYIISGVLILMILMASCYYFCQSAANRVNLDEPEIIEESINATITNESGYKRV